MAQKAGVSSINLEGGQMMVKSDRLEDVDRIGLQQRLGDVVRVARKQIILPQYNQRDWQKIVVQVLEKMAVE
jgi:hypothetical protein